MELNAKISLYPNGSYELLVEEGKGSDFFVEVSDAELKKMAVAYGERQTKKKERGEKAMEEVKKIGKKEKVKAFLKKLLAKKKGKKDAVRILKATIDAGKKALETHTRGFSKKDNDASQFWSAVEVKMKVADSSSPTFEFLRDWFYDVLSYEVDEIYGGGFATDYSDAPKDYINDILSGLHRALTTSKGKMVKVWEQEVEPPYSSRVSLEQIERFEEIFPALSFEDEVEFMREDGEEEDEDDELPYKLEIYARSSK
jgi:hypothetical protein